MMSPDARADSKQDLCTEGGSGAACSSCKCREPQPMWRHEAYCFAEDVLWEDRVGQPVLPAGHRAAPGQCSPLLQAPHNILPRCVFGSCMM